jgi:hypothetical protein
MADSQWILCVLCETSAPSAVKNTLRIVDSAEDFDFQNGRSLILVEARGSEDDRLISRIIGTPIGKQER